MDLQNTRVRISNLDKENIEHKKAFEKVEMLQIAYLSLPSDIKSKISQEVHQNKK